MKVLLVEDEKKGRALLRKMLLELDFENEQIKEAGSVKEAISILASYSPDLIFLDVELGDGDGFDVLESNPERDFQVVFTTGYDQFVIKALQNGATDYLLKPIFFDALEESVARVKKRLLNQQKMIQKATAGNVGKNRLMIKSGSKYEIYNYEDLIAFEAEASYTKIHLKANKTILSAYPLNHFIQILKDPFLQIHRSWVINLKLISSYEQGRGGIIIMENDLKIPVATRRKSAFISKMKELSQE